MVEAEPRIDFSGRHGIDDVANHFADAVSRAMVGAEEATYYSADLTAATDYMPFELSGAIWRGVMDGLGVGEEELLHAGGLSLLGPVAVAYPDLAVEDVPIAHQRGFDGTAVGESAIRRRDYPVVVSRRGCMMGLPLSWFCLNLYNLAMADLSVDASKDPLTQVPAPLLGAAPAICRGDDLAAAFRPAEILRYEALVLESGCRANVPKSFRSNDSFVLAERTFVAEAAPDTSRRIVVQGGWQQRSHGEVSRQAPLLAQEPRILEASGSVRMGRQKAERRIIRGVTPLQDVPVRHLMPSGDASGLPPYITLPPAAAAVLEEFERSRFYEPLCRAVIAVNGRVAAQLRHFKIPMFYPRELGGGGFPHPKGFAKAVQSGGDLLYLRATLQITTHTLASRRKYDLVSNPWDSNSAKAERERALSQLQKEESRAMAAGQLG